MRAAKVDNGIVTNVIKIDRPEFAGAHGLIISDEVNIGDSWDGQAFSRPPLPSVSKADVKAERDRRMSMDFEFRGKMYQRDERSLARITVAATMAVDAMRNGAQIADFRWHGGDENFQWIASDNSLTAMDAPSVVAFGKAAALVETKLVFSAHALRQMRPIPNDYQDDKWWT